jgi:hypothetical protein
MKSTANAATITQYRVAFTYLDTVNGSVRRVAGSTRWYDTLGEAQKSQWVREDDAKIVTREYQP